MALGVTTEGDRSHPPVRHHRSVTTGERGGRPAATSAHELAGIAQQLFLAQGYEATSVDDVAAAAGIGRRTFFRYFATKADVLFLESPADVDRLRTALASAPDDESTTAALRRGVLLALAVAPGDEEWARARAQLILGVPALQAHAHTTFDAWRETAAAFTARRMGCAVEDLVPVAVGHSALAASLAAHEHWVAHPGTSLADALGAALDLVLPEL